MPKDEWGVKRLCPHCASRFYDLRRDPMTCPECAQVFSAESLSTQRSRSALVEKAAIKEAAAETDADDLIEEPELEDDGSDVDLDDDLLEDDDDDTVPLDEIADVSTNDDDS
ncbi:MAG: TIGR02300 family protein [Albidovulum sp.]|jgi:uncharacterized protein (TIGR02300 family)